MKSFRVKVGNKGEVFLPEEILKALNLVAGDDIQLNLNTEGKISVQSSDRAAGPLVDFFEDLILNDIKLQGYGGEKLREQFLERKIQLSTAFDQLALDAYRAMLQDQVLTWREYPSFVAQAEELSPGNYKVLLTFKAEQDLLKLQVKLLQELPQVFWAIEKEPQNNKRLRGPYYETFRVSLNGETNGRYRVIYTVFAEKQLAIILAIDERQSIYGQLKNMAKPNRLGMLPSSPNMKMGTFVNQIYS